MKIAVACEGANVAGHFGHCENFTIFTTDNKKIVSSQVVPNPGHRPGFLPVFLHDLGINVIISGGMGGGAVEIFNEKGITVMTGAAGNAQQAAPLMAEGRLESTGSICHEHQHHDDCGN